MTRHTKVVRKTHEPATGWSEMSETMKTAQGTQHGSNLCTCVCSHKSIGGPRGGVGASTTWYIESSRAQKAFDRKKRFQQLNVTCFGCRQRGHAVSNCPQADSANICYRCGAEDHTTQTCKKKTAPGQVEFPFATCFICKEKGHLSRACPDNPRGLYPNGGGCKGCGSVEHLRRDCPMFQTGIGWACTMRSLTFAGRNKMRLGLSTNQSADAEEPEEPEQEEGGEEEAEEAPKAKEPKKELKKKKVVKF